MAKLGSKIMVMLFALMVVVGAVVMPTAQSANGMQIFVKVFETDGTSDLSTLEVEPNMLIAEIKAKIREKYSHIDTDKMAIIFAGKYAGDDNKTLSDYNIQKESTIYLIIKTATNSCHETANCDGIYINGSCCVCEKEKTALPQSNDNPWLLPAILGGVVGVVSLIIILIVVATTRKRV